MCIYGTSAAAPHVTGVAALLLSLDPMLTGKQLKEKILQGSDSITISTLDWNQILKELNVTLLNCNITCRVSKSVVGAITGYMSSGSIYQCEVKGGVYDSSGFSLGGMVGWHHNGLIHDSKCETKLKVNSTENYGELIAFPEKAASYGVQNCETNVTIDKPCVAAGTLITLADGRQMQIGRAHV